ncbi:hypothetical protein AGMMS49940_19210 [Spirochaetia bacterium]|nr:hypothetical protein AGMMS49940_19210 [Spirochaetia bacterium]
MLNAILTGIAAVMLAGAAGIVFFIIFKSDGEKRGYFLLLHMAIMLYFLGHVLEISGNSPDAAYTGAKLHFIGGIFVPALAFFYFCDHCGKKVRAPVKALLLLVPGILALLGATNDLHHLLIVRYWFAGESVHQLAITPGILYFSAFVYLILSLLFLLASILVQLNRGGGGVGTEPANSREMREWLQLFLLCVLIILLGQAAYILSIALGLNPHHINIIAFALAFADIIMVLNRRRYGISRKSIAPAAGTAGIAALVDEAARRYGLSRREQEVALAVLRGKANKEIAGELDLSPRTVEFHLQSIYRKTGAAGRIAFIALFREQPGNTASIDPPFAKIR